MLIYPTFVSMKRTLYIPFIVGMLFISLSCGAGHTPKSTVKHFFSALEDGKYDKALSYTTLSEDADYELYYAIMDKEHNSIVSKGGIKKIDVTNQEPSLEDENQITITSLIHYGDGSTHEEYCDMVKDGNRWKIHCDLNAK